MLRRPIIILSVILLFSACQQKKGSPKVSESDFAQAVLERSKGVLENIFSPYDTCANQFANTQPPLLELCVVQNHLDNYSLGCYKYQLRSVSNTPTEIFGGEVVVGMFVLFGQSDTLNASVSYYMPLEEKDFIDNKESGVPSKVIVYQHVEEEPIYESIKCLSGS